MKKHHTISLTLLALVLAVGLFSLYQNIGGGKLAEDFQFITEPSRTYTPRRFQMRQTRLSEASKTSAAPP